MLLHRFIIPITSPLGLLLLCLNPWQAAIAQPIVPAADGTGTTVIFSQPNQFNIQGGTISGENLFHSFEQFGLDANQVGNFISNPEIKNILGRVTGGNPSYINGLIQVTGGNSNLFLINPAGMIFGENASLNVPAAFTATSADAVGFGAAGWFNVQGENNWSELVGSPTGFRFDAVVPGTLINLGELEVNPGQQLNLIGGRVISTGRLSAPEGNIWVQAVPGESVIRMSQAGQLLTLDLPTSGFNSSEETNLQLNPIELPQLLTGGETQSATAVEVNEAGELVLQNNQPIQPGDVVIVSENDSPAVVGGNAIFNAAGTLTLAQTQLQTTGNLNLLAGDTVRIRDSLSASTVNTSSFLATVGGNLTILGQNSIDILALNFPTATEASFNVGGNLTLISDGIISGDSHFNAGGNFSLLNTTGDYGTFISLFDPIIRSSGDVFFGDYTGASLKIEAAGAILGGDINITRPDTTLTNTTDPDANLLRSQPTLILRSGVSSLGNSGDLVTENLEAGEFASGPTTSPITGNEIRVGNLTTAGGPVIINSPGEITLGTIRTNGGDIIVSGQENIAVTGTVGSTGGDINISTNDTLQVNGQFIDPDGTPASISSAAGNGEGGDINITYNPAEGDFVVGDNSQNGTASGVTSGSNTLNTVLPVEGGITQGNITIGTPDEPTPPNNPLDPTPTPDEPTPTPDEPTPTPDEPTPTPDPTPTPNPPIIPPTQQIPIIPPLEPTPTPTPPPDDDNPGDDEFDLPDNNDIIETITEPIRRSESQPEARTNTQPINNQSLLSVNDTTEQVEINQDDSSQQQLKAEVDEEGNVSLVEDTSEVAVNESSEVAEVDSSESAIEITRIEATEALDTKQIDQSITTIDQLFDFEYTGYFGKELENDSELSVEDIQATLISIGEQLNNKPAIIYTFVRDNQLEILLITGDGERVHKTIPAAEEEILSRTTRQLFQGIFTSRYRRVRRYLQPAQQLYQWIIKPIEAELELAGVDTLLFAMDGGLRSLPLGVLHDGEQFLIEKYSLSLIPSFNLINTRYQPLNDAKVLAMGASEFQDQQPLPAVPIEIKTITSQLRGDYFLNEAFTIDNFQQQRDEQPYQIVHLATHGEFRPGEPGNSYIQFWDSRLTLNELQELGWRWNNPPIDLLVLSACRSALGDKQAELGFAGLAVQAGVPSALASLWYVSDQGSLALMAQFYHQLQATSTKADALREAQLAMLRGEVRIQSGELLYDTEEGNRVVLPPELADQNHQDFSHPYYWAGWTIIGSPW